MNMSKEICSNLVFCVNLGLLILSFLVEEAPHSADLLNLLILCVITANRVLRCSKFDTSFSRSLTLAILEPRNICFLFGLFEFIFLFRHVNLFLTGGRARARFEIIALKENEKGQMYQPYGKF